MIDDCSFCRCRGVSCVQGIRTIDDCSFCRCRGISCVQGVKMIDECSLCYDHDIYKTNNHLST
jgi:hypothetical protein